MSDLTPGAMSERARIAGLTAVLRGMRNDARESAAQLWDQHKGWLAIQQEIREEALNEAIAAIQGDDNAG